MPAACWPGAGDVNTPIARSDGSGEAQLDPLLLLPLELALLVVLPELVPLDELDLLPLLEEPLLVEPELLPLLVDPLPLDDELPELVLLPMPEVVLALPELLDAELPVPDELPRLPASARRQTRSGSHW